MPPNEEAENEGSVLGGLVGSCSLRRGERARARRGEGARVAGIPGNAASLVVCVVVRRSGFWSARVAAYDTAAEETRMMCPLVFIYI